MKEQKITKLNTGLTTMIDGKGRVHVFTKQEMQESKSDWKTTIRFLFQILILGGVSLAIAYILEK